MTMPFSTRKLSERRGSATDRQKNYARLLAREAMAVGYLVDFGLDPMRGIENASMKDASTLIDRLAKAKAAGWPGSRVSRGSTHAIHATKKKTARQLDREVAQALAGQSSESSESSESSDTGSAFHNFLIERFPSGDVPWSWVQKILKGHGVPLPLMIGLGKEDAEGYGIRQGKPADVHQLARFLGY